MFMKGDPFYINIREFAKERGFPVPGTGRFQRDDVIIQEAINHIVDNSLRYFTASYKNAHRGICGVVYLPPGQYKLASPIILPRRITIVKTKNGKTESIPANITVHLIGAGSDQTNLEASGDELKPPDNVKHRVRKQAFPSNRAIIEWEWEYKLHDPPISMIEEEERDNLRGLSGSIDPRILPRDYSPSITYLPEYEGWHAYKGIQRVEYDKTVSKSDIMAIKNTPTNFHYNRISGLTFWLPQGPEEEIKGVKTTWGKIKGVKAIHYRVYQKKIEKNEWKQQEKLKKHAKAVERERLRIILEDIRVMYTYPLCSDTLIDLEGPVYQSRFEKIHGIGFRMTMLRKNKKGKKISYNEVYRYKRAIYYDKNKKTKKTCLMQFKREPAQITLLGFDDFVLGFEDASRLEYGQFIMNEGTGLVFSTVRNLKMQGGGGTLIRGRALWSTIENCLSDGSLMAPVIDLRRSYRVTLRNIAVEGRSEKAQIRFKDCLGIVAEDVPAGSPDTFYFHRDLPNPDKPVDGAIYVMPRNKGLFEDDPTIVEGKDTLKTPSSKPLPTASQIQDEIYKTSKGKTLFKNVTKGIVLEGTTDSVFRLTPTAIGKIPPDKVISVDENSVRNLFERVDFYYPLPSGRVQDKVEIKQLNLNYAWGTHITLNNKKEYEFRGYCLGKQPCCWLEKEK